MSMKTSDATIRNWAHDLPACSSVPQPTVPPPSPPKHTLHNLHLSVLIMTWTFVTHRSSPQDLNCTTVNTEHIMSHWKNVHKLNCFCLLSNTVQLQPPYILYTWWVSSFSSHQPWQFTYLVNNTLTEFFDTSSTIPFFYLHKVLCIS